MPKHKKGTHNKQPQGSGKKKKGPVSPAGNSAKFVLDENEGDSNVKVPQVLHQEIETERNIPILGSSTVNDLILNRLMEDNARVRISSPSSHVKLGLGSVGLEATEQPLLSNASLRADRGYGRGVTPIKTINDNPVGMNSNAVLIVDSRQAFEDADGRNEKCDSSSSSQTIGETGNQSKLMLTRSMNLVQHSIFLEGTGDNVQSPSPWLTHEGLVEDMGDYDDVGDVAFDICAPKHNNTVPNVGNALTQNPNVIGHSTLNSSQPTIETIARTRTENFEGNPDNGLTVEADKAEKPTNIGADNDHLSAKKSGKVSFASLFTENRNPLEKHKVVFTTPPTDKFRVAFDEFETVEKTIGFCLVGCVLGRFPGARAVMDFVKRWGNTVQFRVHPTGWITFYFQNATDRDRALNGGPYMILGRQLFLQILPRCFLYRKEDMQIVPSWIQIHGLPPDLWNNHLLGRVASVVGKPLHTDRVTLDNKKSKFARVLVEIDTQKPLVRELDVYLPTNQVAMVKFVFEFEPKYCDSCTQLGHDTGSCPFTPKPKHLGQPVNGKHKDLLPKNGNPVVPIKQTEVQDQGDTLPGLAEISSKTSSLDTGSSSSATEFVHLDADTLLPRKDIDTVLCSLKDMKGRRPRIASVDI